MINKVARYMVVSIILLKVLRINLKCIIPQKLSSFWNIINKIYSKISQVRGIIFYKRESALSEFCAFTTAGCVPPWRLYRIIYFLRIQVVGIHFLAVVKLRFHCLGGYKLRLVPSL